MDATDRKLEVEHRDAREKSRRKAKSLRSVTHLTFLPLVLAESLYPHIQLACLMRSLSLCCLRDPVPHK